MKAFRFEDYEVKFDPEVLFLEPFRKIWERDKSKDKRMARLEMAYVYFMEDARSDYMEHADRETRGKEIAKGEGLPEKWKADKVVDEACEFYRSKQPPQAKWLESERMFISKLEQTMRSIDPGLTDDKGRLINPLNQTTQLINTLNDAMLKYTETERRLFTNMYEKEKKKVRGKQEKADFEDLDF